MVEHTGLHEDAPLSLAVVTPADLPVSVPSLDASTDENSTPPLLKRQREIDTVSGICTHGRLKGLCKECGGSGICTHGRRKDRCKECGGSGICTHGRQKHQCKECGGN